MGKYILCFAALIVVGCSDSPQQVITPPLSQMPDNSNVVCVVGDQSYACNANSWSYTDEQYNVQKSCSDYGRCRNGQACVLFNGELGACESVDAGK